VVSIFLGLGMSILSASFASFLVAERMNNAKHLQVCFTRSAVHTCAQLHNRVGRTLVPPSATLRRKTWVGEPVAVSRQYTFCPVHAVTAQSLPRIRYSIRYIGNHCCSKHDSTTV
jgi:hypothetical protein